MPVKISDLTRTARTKIQEDPESGCWLWTGSLDSSGYASMKMHGKVVIVHRYCYEKLIGPILLDGDDDPTLDHLNCVSRACVRPDHMQVVSRSENSRRANETRHRGLKFTNDGTAVPMKGKPK